MRWHPVSGRKNITDLRHPQLHWEISDRSLQAIGRLHVGHGMPWISMQWRMQYTGALDLYGQDWKVSSKKNLEPCNVSCLLVESKKPAYAVEGVGNLWKVQVCMGQPDYSLWNFAKSSLLLVPSVFAMDSFYLCPSKRTAKKQNSKFKMKSFWKFSIMRNEEKIVNISRFLYLIFRVYIEI
jgi:hypothetical protein